MILGKQMYSWAMVCDMKSSMLLTLRWSQKRDLTSRIVAVEQSRVKIYTISTTVSWQHATNLFATQLAAPICASDNDDEDKIFTSDGEDDDDVRRQSNEISYPAQCSVSTLSWQHAKNLSVTQLPASILCLR